MRIGKDRRGDDKSRSGEHKFSEQHGNLLFGLASPFDAERLLK
jgi:hypothetical protein